ESVKSLLNNSTAAIMLEPVQGEAGVIPATPEFLQSLRDLADRENLLLIFDEVQTAPARLGTWFGYQLYGVVPDIITTAKAIAGGMPMAVLLAKKETADFLKPGTHASTFGGHSLGCAAGVAGILAMREEGVLENVKNLGNWLGDRLQELQANHPAAIRTVRRSGFMVGIDLNTPGEALVTDCRDHGLLINCTHQTVIRLLPALNISQAELAEGLGILSAALGRLPLPA
ncbi:MAG: aminotransferase class III-fold pyridoxal phosphate-dependent enzyme, partial [Planctomycetota bacterium]|nr:aminotransferase class III-fold pyridoxal phosphate-dependent enzyme [Planctomycetota bacterium]